MSEELTTEESLPPVDDSPDLSPVKKRRGNPAFRKGVSGNPLGRPKGGKNRATLVQEAIKQQAEDLLIRYLPDVVEEVIQQARKGNMVAAKMLLDRAIPVKRAVEISNKDGKEFGVKIIIENLVTHETKAEEAEEAEFMEAVEAEESE